MTLANLGGYLRTLLHGLAADTRNKQADSELVEQALNAQNEGAFQTIINRHGAMVYQVCWRVSQHTQDAEDAFQTTFLVLARKLGTLRKRTSLASWLHGVAHRVALKARDQSDARRQRERRAAVPESRPDDITLREACSVLDAELSKLPEKWRQPLILCYLEGRTQDEAAEQLGCSPRTVRRRLEEAKNTLSNRLNEQGIAWTIALSTVLINECTASAALPPNVVVSTVDAASAIIAGEPLITIVSPNVSKLTRGVINTMFLNQFKSVATLSSGVGILCLLSGFLVFHAVGQGQLTAEQANKQQANIPQQPIEQKAEPPAHPRSNIVREITVRIDFNRPLPNRILAESTKRIASEKEAVSWFTTETVARLKTTLDFASEELIIVTYYKGLGRVLKHNVVKEKANTFVHFFTTKPKEFRADVTNTRFFAVPRNAKVQFGDRPEAAASLKPNVKFVDDPKELARMKKYYPHGFHFVDGIRYDGKIIWHSKVIQGNKLLVKTWELTTVTEFKDILSKEKISKLASFEVHLPAVNLNSKLREGAVRAQQILDCLHNKGYRAGKVSN